MIVTKRVLKLLEEYGFEDMTPGAGLIGVFSKYVLAGEVSFELIWESDAWFIEIADVLHSVGITDLLTDPLDNG